MKRTLGIYVMVASFLMSFYLIFNVYLPAQMALRAPAPVQPQATVTAPVPRSEQAVPVNLQQGDAAEVPSGEPLSITADPEPEADPQPVPVPDPVPQAQKEAVTAALTVREGKVARHASKYERNEGRSGPGKAGPLFDVPRGLRTEVDFWIKIYSKYTNDQAVLHDPDDLGRVFGVIDLPHCDEPPTKACIERREETIQNAKDEIARRLGRKAPERIRAQIGQRDKFEEGIIASRKFLGQIERVFSEYDIPKEISRLPFVESMFNNKAYSRSKAAGIWQLMPATARIFGLRVDARHDERYDPVKATTVAAKHLVRDYKRLGSWPLAINAYNSGPGRIADAVNRLGTKDITKIIKHYDNPSYGFAARNFYPCFLAALNVYENRERYFGAGHASMAGGTMIKDAEAGVDGEPDLDLSMEKDDDKNR